MTSSRSVMYMSELDIGMTLPDYFTALIRAKIGSASARRSLVLRATKLKAEEAVEMGIVDSAHASAEEAVQAAMCLCEELSKKRWDGKVYAEIRKALYPELCGLLGLKDESILPSKL
ncbi:Enoyl-CoA delta isomerase 2 [Abeliophyllum distichum]